MFRRLLSTSIFTTVMLSGLCTPIVVQSQILSESEETAPSGEAPIVSKRLRSNDKSVKDLELMGVKFKAPKEFSDIRILPRKTAGIVYPAGDIQDPKMIVRFAEVPASGAQWSYFSPAEQMTFIRYKILGNNNLPPREFSRRQFFGQTLTGEVQTIRTRTGYRYVELYIVPLEKSQRNIAISFESDTLLSLATVENTIKTVTDSMYEMSKSELKEYRKQEKKKQKEQLSRQPSLK